MGPIAIGDVRYDDTIAVGGVVSDFSLLRIIASDSLRKRNAALRCTVHIVDWATTLEAAELPVIPPLPKKKKKRR